MHALNLILISPMLVWQTKIILSFWMQLSYLMNAISKFDLIPLVGSADKLISSDYHEDKHPKPYPIVGRHFLGKKSPHL